MLVIVVGAIMFACGIAFTLAIAPWAAQKLAPAPAGAPTSDLLASYRAGVVEHSTDLKILAPDGALYAHLGRGSYWHRNPLRRIAYGLFEKPLVERRIAASNRHQLELAAQNAQGG